MKDFVYTAPSTLTEALAALAAAGSGSRLLAGGTDILVRLREGTDTADHVVDVKRIPELNELFWDAAGGLRLGAAVPCFTLTSDAGLRAAYPSLADACAIIGGWQIQCRASVGGNLCNASPAADTVPALIVEAANCVLAGPGGARSIAAGEFCVAPGKTVLGRGEILVRLELPPRRPRSGSSYVRFIPRNEMDIAVAGAGAWLQLDAAGRSIEEARIALAAVAPRPVFAAEASRWLRGKEPTEAVFREAGDLAKLDARPISDHRAPREYRMHLVAVLVRQALDGACRRARGGAPLRTAHP